MENEENMPIIPVNSGSIEVKENTSRFSSAIWYDYVKTRNIALAGLGGIGSYVAFLLSRLNVLSITLIDPDRVDFSNLSGQLYNIEDVGHYKAGATASRLAIYSAYHNISAVSYVYEDRFSEDIMICGFDNMKARKQFYTSWLSRVERSEDPSDLLFIDGRLAAEELQVFCIQGDDIEAMRVYEKEWLFSDKEADETICSYKQTTFMANMIGSIITNLFVNFCANKCDSPFPRDLPFMTTYNASMMKLIVKDAI